MFRYLILSAGLVVATAPVTSVSAQVAPLSALSNCDPLTGLTPNGTACVELTPIDPASAINTPVGASGAEQYEALDTTTLGQTYRCDQRTQRDGDGVLVSTLLIEDCGTPLLQSELGPLKPFFGTTGAPAPVPAPAPVVLAPAPPPVAVPVAPAPVVVSTPVPIPPAPPVFAPVAATGGFGLGAAGLAAVGVGAAALVGLAVLIDDDDDDNSTTATTRR